MPRFPATLFALVAAPLALACSSSDDSSDGPAGPACKKGQIEAEGQCILDPYRWEPAEQLDLDNVVAGNPDDAFVLLDLPPPPKSGFRLMMEPRVLEGGDEQERCHSWQLPDLTHRWIYTAELHSSPGMHHANLYGLKPDEVGGPQPSPGCRGRADGQIFGQLQVVFTGGDTSNLIAPTVLFANSTQVLGGERYGLAEGYAFKIEEGFEVMTDIHLQNTTPDELRVEAAWDFYTMPESEVVNPSKMFVYIFFDFLIPPRSQKTLTAECNWAGGEVAAIMPHTHQWATGFNVEFGTAKMRDYDDMPEIGGWENTLVKPYDRQGTGLSDSDIQTYDPPVNTDGADSVRFECHFDNTTDHDMCFGIGENEMCFLFGYTSPPEAQRVGVILTEGSSCLTLNPADAGKKTFDIGGWLDTQPPEAAAKIISDFTGGPETCPYQQ